MDVLPFEILFLFCYLNVANLYCLESDCYEIYNCSMESFANLTNKIRFQFKRFEGDVFIRKI